MNIEDLVESGGLELLVLYDLKEAVEMLTIVFSFHACLITFVLVGIVRALKKRNEKL